MSTNEIRFGVIGAGNMGESIFRGFYKSGKTSGVLKSIYDPDSEKCKALAKSFG